MNKDERSSAAPGRSREPTQDARRPRIALIATGGTIAGRGKSSASTGSYEAGVLSIDDIVAAVPDLGHIASIRCHQLMNLPSKNMTDAAMIEIARAVCAAVESPDVDGVVVTHGTDTVEETAYFLHLTIRTSKPIVMVGAMRPSTALSADGPINLYDAVRVAANLDACGKGALLVLNGEIFSARDVIKCDTFRANAFRSPFGPIGLVVEGRELFYRSPLRKHTQTSDFDITTIAALPDVQIAYMHAGVSDHSVLAAVDANVAGIVLAGTGGANVPDRLLPALQRARSGGAHVVRTSRTGGGSALCNPNAIYEREGLIVADDQTPQKARLLLALALTQTKDVESLQHIFTSY